MSLWQFFQKNLKYYSLSALKTLSHYFLSTGALSLIPLIFLEFKIHYWFSTKKFSEWFFEVKSALCKYRLSLFIWEFPICGSGLTLILRTCVDPDLAQPEPSEGNQSYVQITFGELSEAHRGGAHLPAAFSGFRMAVSGWKMWLCFQNPQNALKHHVWFGEWASAFGGLKVLKLWISMVFGIYGGGSFQKWICHRYQGATCNFTPCNHVLALHLIVASRSSEKHWEDFTLTGSFIDQQLITFLTAALKTAHCIPADVITASIVQSTFINICDRKKYLIRRIRKNLITEQNPIHSSEDDSMGWKLNMWMNSSLKTLYWTFDICNFLCLSSLTCITWGCNPINAYLG